jgi:ubiquinone/menaquinone biosynthesis C-methylase UbiE
MLKPPHHHHPGHRFDQIERLRSPERLERLEVNRVADLALEGASYQSVLDIGTGSGIFAEVFAGRGLTVTGIDANPEMLEAARTFLPTGDFRQAAAESLPFPDQSFDLAFMGLVLHETDDLYKALQEAYRVCKTRLAILEWPYAEQDFGPGLEERLRPEYIETLAKQAGFERSEIIPLNSLGLYRFEKGGSNKGQLS